MNYLDWFLTIILASGAVWGFRKGLIKSIMSFLAIGLAIWIGFKFSGLTEGFVAESETIPDALVPVVSLILTIVLIYFAIKLLGKILHGMTHTIGLGIFNRLGGALFGILLNVLMLSSLVYYVLPFFDSLIGSELISQSKVLPYLQEVVELFKQNFHIFTKTLNGGN